MIHIASLTVIARGSWVGQIKWAFRLYIGCTSKDLFNPSLLPKPIPKLFHMNGLTVWYLMLWIKPYSMLFQGTKIFWVFHFLKGLQEQTFCPPHICCFLTPSPLPLSLFIFGCKLRIAWKWQNESQKSLVAYILHPNSRMQHLGTFKSTALLLLNLFEHTCQSPSY